MDMTRREAVRALALTGAGYGSYVPWGLWVALYFHGVGMAGGAFVLGAGGYVLGLPGFRSRRVLRTVIVLSIAAIIPSFMGVWLDMGHLDRAHFIFLRPALTSMMAFNAWMYNVFMFVAAGCFFLSFLRDDRQWLKPLLCLGILFSVLFPHLNYATDYSSALAVDGSICPKGQSGLQTAYDPYRLRQVLKRAGKRGENKWVTIPFDQAIREICDGGTLFAKVSGEEHRQVEGLRSLMALTDPNVAVEMSKDIQAIWAETDRDRKNALVTAFQRECHGSG